MYQKYIKKLILYNILSLCLIYIHINPIKIYLPIKDNNYSIYKVQKNTLDIYKNISILFYNETYENHNKESFHSSVIMNNSIINTLSVHNTLYLPYPYYLEIPIYKEKYSTSIKIYNSPYILSPYILSYYRLQLTLLFTNIFLIII